ncbi:hypothetical protein ACFTAO_05890 [Paenibacillus rhizoplanae]
MNGIVFNVRRPPNLKEISANPLSQQDTGEYRGDPGRPHQQQAVHRRYRKGQYVTYSRKGNEYQEEY